MYKGFLSYFRLVPIFVVFRRYMQYVRVLFIATTTTMQSMHLHISSKIAFQMQL